MRTVLRHCSVIVFIAIAVILMTWPVFESPLTKIPGKGGDSYLFLWEIWRVQESLDHGEDPLYTSAVLHPQRSPLVFHTHAILHATLLYPIRDQLGLIGTYNLWVFLSLVIGGWGASVLGFHFLKDWRAALVVGMIFTFAPYRMAHLQSHLNLVSLHWVPWLLLCCVRFRTGLHWSVAAGVFVSLIAWTDLSCLFHVSVVVGVMILHSFITMCRMKSFQAIAVPRLWIGVSLSALLVLGLTSPLVLAVIQSSQDFSGNDAGFVPDIEHARYFSARLSSFVKLPDLHPMARHFSDPTVVERQVYIGVGVLTLCVVALLRCPRGTHGLGLWLVVTLSAATLSLGPSLLVHSGHTASVSENEFHLPLPGHLFDYIPFANMSRCPARFMSIAMIGFAVLAGFGSRCWLRQKRYGRAVGLCLIILVEYAVVPFPSTEVNTRFERRMNGLANGTVIDLPFGAGSSLSPAGVINHRCDLFQTAHRLPRVGGMLSRCDDSIKQRLSDEPVLGTLIRLYDGERPRKKDKLLDARNAYHVLLKYDIRYVAVQKRETGRLAHRYIRQLFPDSQELELRTGEVWIDLQPSRQRLAGIELRPNRTAN